jgi:signal transduction histidine kinase
MIEPRQVPLPRLVVDGERAPTDPRVAAVLEVLRGDPLSAVARRWSVDTALLHRWVIAFTDAGTARVTNRPDPEAARQRDRFLAAFAHELRTPLAVAQGWVDMLLEDDLPTAMRSASMAQVRKGLGRLADRVVDLELMAAASMGRLAPHLEPVTLGDLAASVGVDRVGGEGPAATVCVDRGLFGHVVRDLWAAAATAPAPTSRRLEVRTVAPWREVRVVREGDPIATPVLQALYDPFEHNSDETGVTIGLYIARALTVAHGGTLGVAQDETGAVLWVRVPITPEPTAVPPDPAPDPAPDQ